MNQATDQPNPTARQLIRATIVALFVAMVILIVAVLPAEYGIDPTGIGKSLGLTTLNNAELQADVAPGDAAVAPTASNSAAVAKVAGSLRTEERSIVLAANKGIELKANMDVGQAFVFSWTADSRKLYVDMHAEPHGAADDEFTSYWEEKLQRSGQGTYTAQFDGTHGWYWQNMSEKDITIKIQISGFYHDIYQP